MAHDQFLREMYEHLDQVDDDVFVPFRPLRPRTRKSGRRVTRTDHRRARRLDDVKLLNRPGGYVVNHGGQLQRMTAMEFLERDE